MSGLLGSVELVPRYLMAAGPKLKNSPPKKVLVRNRLPTEIAKARHSHVRNLTAYPLWVLRLAAKNFTELSICEED